jgi:hypothetical protein
MVWNRSVSSSKCDRIKDFICSAVAIYVPHFCSPGSIDKDLPFSVREASESVATLLYNSFHMNEVFAKTGVSIGLKAEDDPRREPFHAVTGQLPRAQPVTCIAIAYTIFLIQPSE